ncbi:MAG TPA: helix-turn-helix transcriptional regulator [Spirochaetales bacterium]|nr:helix-turn-helix transcriptional regulator [Spirochaetales bacterium]HRZ64133.1 helix-turn-helix transcriptional regulator [Spirochaetia bacterium]
MKEKPGRRCHPLLEPLVGVAKALGAMLGPDYEVVLHDTSRGAHSIVEICNGELTGRTKEAPLTDFGEFLLDSPEYEGVDHVANYPSVAPDGRPMRSSVAIVRGAGGEVIGFLCINYDLTRAAMLKDLADFLTSVRPLASPCLGAEKIQAKPEGHMRGLLEEAKRSRGGAPLRLASKQERLDFLERLDEAGFFSIKGSMEAVCAELGKSPYTIYGDLRSLRDLRSRRSP